MSTAANNEEISCLKPAGAGANGAIIHYRAEAKTAGTVDKDTHLLIDSGGQYDCGTTDISAHAATCQSCHAFVLNDIRVSDDCLVSTVRILVNCVWSARSAHHALW